MAQLYAVKSFELSPAFTKHSTRKNSHSNLITAGLGNKHIISTGTITGPENSSIQALKEGFRLLHTFSGMGSPRIDIRQGQNL